MKLNGKTVMVTGATGLLGGAVVRMLLSRGDVHVRAFARDRHKAGMFQDDPVQVSIGDVTERDTVRRATAGCDVVIHSVMAVGNGDTRQVNVEGTRNVLDAAVEEGVDRLVHISSVAVFHPVSDGVVDEAHPKEPDGSGTSYHDTKLESETLALDYAREKGLAVVVLQPAAVYGPRAGYWSVQVLERLRDHTVVLVDEATRSRNIVYVDDLARAMVLATEQDGIEGECFIISGKEDIAGPDFYRAHESMLGTTCVAEATAQELESLGGDLKALALQKGMPADRPVVQAKFGENVHVSCEKACRLLGWEPEVEFAEGMKRTEAWARAEVLP